MEEEPLFRTKTGKEDMNSRTFRIELAKKHVSKLASQRVSTWAAAVSHSFAENGERMGHGTNWRAISPAIANP
jgi:hypothetical protein